MRNSKKKVTLGVCIVLGVVLIAVVLYVAAGELQRARVKRSYENVRRCIAAARRFRKETGDFPNSLQTLRDLGYIDLCDALDAWGRELVIVRNVYGVFVFSRGPDGILRKKRDFGLQLASSAYQTKQRKILARVESGENVDEEKVETELREAYLASYREAYGKDAPSTISLPWKEWRIITRHQ